MILLVGCNGNMGRRYAAILKHLHIPFKGIDIRDRLQDLHFERYDKCIIATPTNTHIKVIKDLCDYSGTVMNMLVEKPIAKFPTEMEDLARMLGESRNKIEMVDNYCFARKSLRKNEEDNNTEYNYYNSGSDGLVWDCIQFLNLAEGPVTLRKTSPIWSATINGRDILRASMDQSYIRMINEFAGGKRYFSKYDQLLKLHWAAWRGQNECDKNYEGNYWHTGQVKFD